MTKEMALIGLKSIYLRFPCGVPFIAQPAVRLTGGAYVGGARAPSLNKLRRAQDEGAG